MKVTREWFDKTVTVTLIGYPPNAEVNIEYPGRVVTVTYTTEVTPIMPVGYDTTTGTNPAA